MFNFVLNTLGFFTLLVGVNVDAFLSPSSIRPPLNVNLHEKASSPTTQLLLAHRKDRTIYNEITSLNLPIGEAGRVTRRDVYTEPDWVAARSDKRVFYMLGNTFVSAIVGQLFQEVCFMTAIAFFVISWNALLVEGYADFEGVHHEALYQLPDYIAMKLPLLPFQLSSSALGLLLAFRTNQCYARWWEARGCWGLIINHSRNIMRISTSWMLQGATDANEAKRKEQLDRLALSVWEFPRALSRHLLRGAEDEESFAADVRYRLEPDIAEKLISVRHRPTKALYDLTNSVNDLSLPFIKRIEIDKSITVLCDQAGACERILSAPVPLFYTRFTSRLLAIWLGLLPLALWDKFGDSWNHISLLPITAGISFFLYGIEEIAVYMEEPFSVLPMSKMTDGIGLSATEYDQWHEDNEFKVLDRATTYGPEHAKMRQMRRLKVREDEEKRKRNQSDHVHADRQVFNDAAAYAESLKHTHRHNHEHNHVHQHKPDQIYTQSSTSTHTHTNTEVQQKPHYFSHKQSITRTESPSSNDGGKRKPQKGNPPFW